MRVCAGCWQFSVVTGALGINREPNLPDREVDAAGGQQDEGNGHYDNGAAEEGRSEGPGSNADGEPQIAANKGNGWHGVNKGSGGAATCRGVVGFSGHVCAHVSAALSEERGI